MWKRTITLTLNYRDHDCLRGWLDGIFLTIAIVVSKKSFTDFKWFQNTAIQVAKR